MSNPVKSLLTKYFWRIITNRSHWNISKNWFCWLRVVVCPDVFSQWLLTCGGSVIRGERVWNYNSVINWISLIACLSMHCWLCTITLLKWMYRVCDPRPVLLETHQVLSRSLRGSEEDRSKTEQPNKQSLEIGVVKKLNMTKKEC